MAGRGTGVILQTASTDQRTSQRAFYSAGANFGNRVASGALSVTSCHLRPKSCVLAVSDQREEGIKLVRLGCLGLSALCIWFSESACLHERPDGALSSRRVRMPDWWKPVSDFAAPKEECAGKSDAAG